MKQGPRYYIKQRRRRKGITDYRKRLNLLKSRKIRIVVRNSLKNIRVQFIGYEPNGDKIVSSAISNELIKKYNWKYSTSNISAAYLTGFLSAKRALDKGVKEGILDIGRKKPVKGSKIFATLKGVIDAGVICPYDTDKLPDEKRILGNHIDKKIETDLNNIKSKIIGD